MPKAKAEERRRKLHNCWCLGLISERAHAYHEAVAVLSKENIPPEILRLSQVIEEELANL